MADIETVAVKSGDSYALINKSDFKEGEHEIYEGAIPSDLANDLTRNPSGTFSTPTPTDIRFPDKTKTEFENNAGAFIGKSAAGLREEQGLADAPGGLDPDPTLAQQVEAQKQADQSAAKDPLDHDGDGRKGGAVNLDDMTVAELREHAAGRNIDLGDATLKADIRAAIDLANGQ